MTDRDTKKPRIGDTHASQSYIPESQSVLLALPPPLIASIWSYVVSGQTLETSLRKARPIPFVCKDWYKIAKDAVAVESLREQYLYLVAPTRRAMLDMRYNLTMRRAHATSLYVAQVAHIDSSSAQGLWDAALSLMPKLQEIQVDPEERVDWTMIPLRAFLRAAGRQCPRISCVMFPSYVCLGPDLITLRRHRAVIARTLFESAAQWLAASPGHGGLRHLEYCAVDEMRDWQTADAFVNGITACCPNIEKIDGYLESLEGHKFCGELWAIDVETWRRFCEKCTQLVAIHWIHVPFATAFFEIFGQTCHPKLTFLDFAGAANWDWPAYLDNAGVAHRSALQSRGYAASATNVQAVLHGCPALQHLRVEWYYAQAVMNPEIFGDDFCNAVATHCPALEWIQFQPTSRTSLNLVQNEQLLSNTKYIN